jgi:hypothetical protein
VPESEDSITTRILQATTDLLNEPADDDQALMPEGIADVPVSTMSHEHAAVPWEPESTYNTDMQPEDGLDDLLCLEDEDRLSDDSEDNPDREVPDSNWMEFENAEPQAAQSGVTYPAASN